MHILVIEDHDPMAKIIETILVAADHSVTRAANGRSGMELFAKQRFDLVITDILMPDQEGIETIRALVKEQPGVKIIAVSGSGRDGGMDYLRMAEAFGAMATLQKPFQPEDLLQLVRQTRTAEAAQYQ
ncbi:response regulator [Ferrovibrio terrae]|uniref:Response regulator n=1 Tax=Ferrovibrio terrae TaxID=2594003 RepID=A0A516H5H7_9PROT|nr:response regulator [Ferrovibrio terrae]QDO99018.1 response regulator [Ferrovibrio terrae]